MNRALAFNATHLEEALRANVQEALEYALQQGASAAESSVARSKGVTTSARMGKPETIEYEDNQGFSITVYFGTKKGSASSSDTNMVAIKKSVEAACEVAKYICEDEHAGLADRELFLQHDRDLDLDHLWQVDVNEMMQMAVHCENAARMVPQISNSEGASIKNRSHHCRLWKYRGISSRTNRNYAPH